MCDLSTDVRETKVRLKLKSVSAGISMNVQPMYFGESAPKHLRGAIALSSCVFTAFGVVLGQVVGLRYEQHRAARSLNTSTVTLQYLCAERFWAARRVGSTSWPVTPFLASSSC